MSEPCTCPSHAEPGDAWICPAHGHRYILVPYFKRVASDHRGMPLPPTRPDPSRNMPNPGRPERLSYRPPPPAPDHGKPEGTPDDAAALRRAARILRQRAKRPDSLILRVVCSMLDSVADAIERGRL